MDKKNPAVDIVRGGEVFTFTGDFFELHLKFINACSQRPDARVVVRVDLPEALELGLGGYKLPLQNRRRIYHSLALFFDVNSCVLAGELAELLLGGLQVLVDSLQPTLKENSFATGSRRLDCATRRFSSST